MQIYFIIFLFFVYILKILSFLTSSNKQYLTKQEWKYIIDNNLLQNNLIKKKVNEIIYKKYNKLCYFKARNFKRLHKYKCKDIKEEELFIYAIIGLFKSVKNYNGNVELIYYANKYILSELYSVMTKKREMKTLNKHYKYNDYENDEYQDLLESENNEYTKNLYENKKYIEYWKIINNINNKTTKKIAKYKYDFYFNEIRSNSEIAELLCYSDETIRKHIIIIKNELKKYISTNPDFLNYKYLV
jgi:RNA polymerase sigma factor (sigma-70 family)